MIFLDTEYRNNENPEDIVCMVFYDSNTKKTYIFFDDTLKKVKSFIAKRQSEIFVCFVANAELPALISLGVNVTKLKFIDIYVIYLQLAYNHPKYKEVAPSLVNAITVFGLENPYSNDEKEDTRNLILSKKDYTDDEMFLIISYCIKDTKILPKLLDKIKDVFLESTNILPESLLKIALNHGEYLTYFAWVSYHNKGFPINEDRCNSLFDRAADVKKGIARDINNEFSPSLYPNIYKFKTVKKRKTGLVVESYTFNLEGFTKMIRRKGLGKSWPLTNTGKLSLQEDVLLSQCKNNKFLLPIYTARKLERFLYPKMDIRSMMVEGYLKSRSGFWMNKPFGTVTSRTSPQPSKGFILNRASAIRCMLVEPKKGMAIVSADWSAQEMAIQAALSEDQNMVDLYNVKLTGSDIYMHMAYLAGVVKEGANKKDYPKIRAAFKIVALGLGYGKEVTSLSYDIFNSSLDEEGNPTISMITANKKAQEHYNWHKKHFKKFWKWSEHYYNNVKKHKFAVAKDGWFKFYTRKDRSTQWLNHPIQTKAAEMMRIAYVKLAKEDLDIICSLHDAFYVSCNEKDVTRVEKILLRCMSEAAIEAIGSFCPLTAESKVQLYDELFDDQRGFEMANKISDILNWGKVWK